MTSWRLLFIFGVFVTFSSPVLSNIPRTFIPGSDFDECSSSSAAQAENLEKCISKEYMDEELNETRRMYNRTKCVRCRHFCRKQDVIFDCIRESAETIKVLSNKARYMTPLIEEIFVAGASSYCENYKEMETVFGDQENKECFRRSSNKCQIDIDFIDDLDRVAFCDSQHPESDPYNAEFVCQKLLDFLECAEKSVMSCSTDVHNVVSSFISKLRTVESCAKHF